MTLNDLQQFLAEIDLTPSRKLGQNFLIDQNIADWIVDQLEIDPGDTVVEVGPGAGALTRQVLERTDRLILVERDGRLARHLDERLAHRPEVTVHQMDAVQYDTRQLYPLQPVKMIGNLPYSAGGEIIRNFLGQHSPVSAAVLMLQREVAERICAQPRTKAFGVLSLRLQARWVPKVLKHVGPANFHPRPQVESTVISLTPRDPESLPLFDLRDFDSVVRRGFSQRRKQLKKTLQLDLDAWVPLAARLGIAETARAEELTLEQWVDLTRELDAHPLKDNPQKADELFDVVDEKNEVTGQRTRAEVHRDGLLHRATHIFVFNKAGELFLQKRSRLKDVHPGAWDSSAAGHLDAGEGYDVAAKRELEEELGLEEEVQFVAELPPSDANGNEFVHLYEAQTKGKPRWPSSEIEYGIFFPLPIIDEWIEARPQDFAGGFLDCYQKYREVKDLR